MFLNRHHKLSDGDSVLWGDKIRLHYNFQHQSYNQMQSSVMKLDGAG